MKYSFPENFVWGFSSSAYQIEGAVNEGGKGQSIWDTFSHSPGKVFNGDTGDTACDHYHRYEADMRLMKELGIQAYHFSTAWTRIQAEGRGSANQSGLDFYSRLVDAILEQGMTPWLTLFHWDLPQALQDRGGWTNRDTAKYFADYADIMFRSLGDRVPMWLTHNEPWVAAYLGYGIGIHAPGIMDWKQAVNATHTILLSHGLAAQTFRTHSRSAKIGLNPNFYPVHTASDSEEDNYVSKLYFEYANTWFLDALFKGTYPELLWKHYEKEGLLPTVEAGDMDTISVPIDFMGVNYYSRYVVQKDKGAWLDAKLVPAQGAELTAMDWEIYPDGLYEILMHIYQNYPKIDLYITENGAAFDDEISPDGKVHDERRVQFFQKHFKSALRAIQESVPLKGYLLWSFMDNFEWAMGYSKRFGLVFVDYSTQKRIPKDSAVFFKQVIENNSIHEA